MQMKATVKDDFISVWMFYIKRQETIGFRENTNKRTHVASGGNLTWCKHYGNLNNYSWKKLRKGLER